MSANVAEQITKQIAQIAIVFLFGCSTSQPVAFEATASADKSVLHEVVSSHYDVRLLEPRDRTGVDLESLSRSPLPTATHVQYLPDAVMKEKVFHTVAQKRFQLADSSRTEKAAAMARLRARPTE